MEQLETKLDKLAEINNDQNVKLASLEASSTIIKDSVAKHDDLLKKLVEISAINTESLKYHIMRTDILQDRQQKMIIVVAVILGMSLVEFGPEIVKLALKVLI